MKDCIDSAFCKCVTALWAFFLWASSATQSKPLSSEEGLPISFPLPQTLGFGDLWLLRGSLTAGQGRVRPVNQACLCILIYAGYQAPHS